MCLECACEGESTDGCCAYCRREYDETLEQWGRDYATEQMKSFNNDKALEQVQLES
jgi:hypothetical protein